MRILHRLHKVPGGIVGTVRSRSIKHASRLYKNFVPNNSNADKNLLRFMQNLSTFFVPHYAKIALALNQLLKKRRPVQIIDLADDFKQAFQFLKYSIPSPPFLA